MKIIFLLLLYLTNYQFGLMAQLSKLTGRVTYHAGLSDAGTAKPVVGALVRDLSGHADDDDTDVDGIFRLDFYKLEDGKGVILDVSREGLEVVNVGLLKTATGRKDTLNITMASKTDLARIRDEYFKIGFYSLTQKQSKKIKALSAERDSLVRLGFEFTQQVLELQKEITTLNNYIDRQESIANLAANELYRIDIINASDLVKQAMGLYKTGHVDSALSVFEHSDLDFQHKRFLARDQLHELERKGLMESYLVEAQFHLLLNQVDRAFESLDKMLELDTSNVRNLAIKGDYYLDLGDYDKALQEYAKALELAHTPMDKFSLSHNMAVIYMERRDGYLADMTFQKCQEYFSQISDTVSSRHHRQKAALFANLGKMAIIKRQPDLADSLFNAAFSSLTRIATSGTFSDDYRIIQFLFAYATFKSSVKDSLEARKLYFDVITVCDSSQYRRLPDMLNSKGMALSNLANTYASENDKQIAVKYYQSAEGFQRQIYPLNKSKYALPLSNTLNNLGQIFIQKNQYKVAERYLLEAFDVIDPFAEERFFEYVDNRFRIEYNLARLYKKLKRYAEAERYYLLGRNDLKVVAMQDFNSYQGLQIKYVREMSEFYTMIKRPEKAKACTSEADGLDIMIQVMQSLEDQPAP